MHSPNITICSRSTVTDWTHIVNRPKRYNFNEVRGFEERARFLISAAKEALSTHALDPKDKFKRYVKKNPLGIVFLIAPWNYPYLTSVNAVIPAILAGNNLYLN